MNQDLAQILTNTDSLINTIHVDPSKQGSPVDEIRRLRAQMESKIQSYNSIISKANEDIRKDLEDLSRQIQDRVNYLNQPPRP